MKTTTEQKEKKENRNKFFMFLACAAFLLVAFFTMVLLDSLRDTIIFYKLKLEEKSNIIASYEKKDKFDVSCETESDIKLREHIAIYIKKRYSKTPRIIAKEISKRVILLSKQYNLSPELVVGIIEVESMFNPLLESSKGAKGLMQVMPEWVPKLGLKNVNDLHEIDIGIESGIRVFLIHLEEAKGSVSKGLYRYVNKDSSYVERVYSSVGRFVVYRTIIEEGAKNKKELENNAIDKRARINNERTSKSNIS